jgi:hypothetical protein
MNIRWPLWIPAARQDAFLFVVLTICAGYLLLGHFQSLPIVPEFSKLPTQVGDVYFWLAATSILNYLIVIKNSRNDYIFLSQQLLPCAVTTLIIVGCLALIIAYRNGLSLESPNLEKARYLLYAEIHAFIILNVSFLFRETSSPIRDIANDIRCLDSILKRSREIAEGDADQRQEQWSLFQSAARSLTSTFAKHATTMKARFEIGPTSYDLSTAAKAVDAQARALSPEILFKRLAEPDNELAKLVRAIVRNATR